MEATKQKPDEITDQFSRHEALHTASIMMDMVEAHIIDHPALFYDERELADKAHQALFDLYQLIGSRHIK